MSAKRFIVVIICILIALVAQFLGSLQVIIGAPMIAMLLGMLIVNLVPGIDDDFQKETSFVAKKSLNLGIIVTGATLSFQQILGTGSKALPLLILNIIIALTVSNMLAKKMSVSENVANLVGSGTSICGGTAIASVATVINAASSEIAYAMTAIFLMDVVAALLFPYLSKFLGLSLNQAGFLMGSAVNDVSSVGAAEATYSKLIGMESDVAMTVKMARTVLLIGVVIYFSVKNIKKNPNSKDKSQSLFILAVKTIPKFILVFLLMALLNSFGVFKGIESLVNIDLMKIFKVLSKFLIALALAGVGFKVKFKDLFSEGSKPVILGSVTWLALFTSTMIFITIFSSYVG